MPRIRTATFGIRKEISGNGKINPKDFTPEQYKRIMAMANPRRGIVTQLAPTATNKKMRNLTMRKNPDIENIRAILNRRKQIAKERKLA